MFAEEACSEGWQEEEAGPEVHAGLHSPCRGWHHGRCQLCTCAGSCPAAFIPEHSIQLDFWDRDFTGYVIYDPEKGLRARGFQGSDFTW